MGVGMRADNAIRVSLPRGSYESLPVFCEEAVDCRRQPAADLGDERCVEEPVMRAVPFE